VPGIRAGIEEETVSTEVISSPSVREHRPGTWFVAAVALVVGLAAGAVIVAIIQTDSSTSSARAGAPATVVSASCTGDGGALFSVVSAMPTSESDRIVAELSSQTRTLLSSAARSSAGTSTVPASPDPATLAGVLSRLATRDATTVMTGLTPETRAAVGPIPTSPQACR
jgi:hypothetical protein